MANKKITQAEYDNAVAVKAEYERMLQEEMARKRNVYHDVVKPIVEGDAFQTLMASLRGIEAEPEGMFAINVAGVITNMTYLDQVVSLYQPFVFPPDEAADTAASPDPAAAA